MRKFLSLAISICLTAALCAPLSGCGRAGEVQLDPNNPVTITVWNYYNGPIKNAFDALAQEFNETIGEEQGIIIESYAHGNVSELEAAVMAAVNKEVGSSEIPNIFASYADTAYKAEQLGLLADLSLYLTPEEQAEYVDSYIAEGKIGLNGELRIFPVAKSTDLMMINDTFWQPFAEANQLTYDNLATIEGLAETAAKYYEWSGGKSFFGWDYMANLFIVSFKEFDVEIFQVKNGKATVNADREVLRHIWDYYYVPYISGYYSSYGRFRSDDTKVGDILGYMGSTASAAYFPTEVTLDGVAQEVTAQILPAPHFEGAQKVMVQQGAGMVVAKATPEEEYASLLFLKWFTEAEKNIRFALLSGYMPVKKEAIDYDVIMANIAGTDITLDVNTDNTLRVALNEIKTSELYTTQAFSGGTSARAILENHLQDKAEADRTAVVQSITAGKTHADAVEAFNTDENFESWASDITAQLQAAAAEE